MSLVRWNPNWGPFREMEEMMNRLPALSNMRGLGQSAFSPALDMYEEKGNLIVKAQLPGIDPDNVEITVENGVLTIAGATVKEREVEDKNYYRKELHTGSFYRQVMLPGGVKEDEVSAEFEDGLLKISLPKVSDEKGNKVKVKIVKKG